MSGVRRQLGFLIFFAICLLLISVFWLGGCQYGDEMGFSLLAFWIILPISALIIGFLYGKKKGEKKWFLIPVVGLMCVLCHSLTFDLSNTISFGTFNMPRWELAFHTAIPSLIGMTLGCVVSRERWHK